MSNEEIYNIYFHMSGKAEGLSEALGSADFPVLFANAILEYAKRPWVDLTDEEIQQGYETTGHYQTLRPQDKFAVFALVKAIEAKLKEKNNG